MPHNIVIKTVHVPGFENQWADYLYHLQVQAGLPEESSRTGARPAATGARTPSYMELQVHARKLLEESVSSQNLKGV